MRSFLGIKGFFANNGVIRLVSLNVKSQYLERYFMNFLGARKCIADDDESRMALGHGIY